MTRTLLTESRDHYRQLTNDEPKIRRQASLTLVKDYIPHGLEGISYDGSRLRALSVSILPYHDAASEEKAHPTLTDELKTANVGSLMIDRISKPGIGQPLYIKGYNPNKNNKFTFISRAIFVKQYTLTQNLTTI